jgi:hypothetical protein
MLLYSTLVGNFVYSHFNFVLIFEVLMRPTLNTYTITFLRKPASVATSWLIILTYLLSIVVGVALE